MFLSRRKECDKRVFLWSLFMIQLILIAVIILTFGSLSNDLLEQEHNVKFVTNLSENTLFSSAVTVPKNEKFPTQKDEYFFKEFINMSLVGDIFCLRDGVDMVQGRHSIACKCQPDYHGKDCGQPEVLWRSFMTSKIPLNLSSPRREPHKIIYLIHATFTSMETINIQIMELSNIVDLFILCDQSRSESMKKSFKSNAKNQMQRKIVILNDPKCSSKSMYKKFRRSIGIEKGVTVDDIILYSNSDQILNWRAIKYFKWYDNWPQPAKFRLKYTVYGYFWMHPQNTVLGSGACQIRVLDEMFKSDPDRMLATKESGMIVGDLNHIGGWFCQYCYHPLDIVQKLMSEKKMIFFNEKKVIDTEYIEHLIGNGLFVDGKIGLTRLHQLTGKYYAPDSVTNSSWRYQHVLTNLYSTYDDYENE